MGWLILVGLVAAILFLAWVIRRISESGLATAGPQRGPSGVRGVVAICSQGELAFLSVLESVLPEGTRILCKVRVADVIDVYGADFRTVSQKHFDFVICHAESLVPLLAVELDDKSHLTATAQRSDAVKNAVCASAGLPLLRVRAQAVYDVKQLAVAVAGEFDPVQ
jgi:very-short-patch-repair endonuclease